MKSIFRYPGGKSRQAEQIVRLKPAKVKEYREPFVGGGSVFFAMTQRRAEKRWINDRHAGLVAVYEALANRPEEFIAKCRQVDPEKEGEEKTETGKRNSKGYNKRLSQEFDRIKLNTEEDQAYRYFFVNRTVFAGRVNYDLPSRLYFSNPGGWNIVATDALEQAAKHLAGTTITNTDYREVLEAPGDDVWIYADPPYFVNTNLQKSSQVYQLSFTREDHIAFAEAVHRCKHNVCISYDDDEDGFIRSLYDDPKYRIKTSDWNYCGTTNDEKDVGKELFILNYMPEQRELLPSVTLDRRPMTDQDEEDLAACEFDIQNFADHYGVFVRAANALREVWCRRLYRKYEYTSFESYLKDKWGIRRAYAHCMIRGLEVRERLEAETGNSNCAQIVYRLPDHEGQLRELVRVGERTDLMIPIWKSAVEAAEATGKKVTAKLIRDRVNEAIGYEPPAKDHVKALLADWEKASEDERKTFLEIVEAKA